MWQKNGNPYLDKQAASLKSTTVVSAQSVLKFVGTKESRTVSSLATSWYIFSWPHDIRKTAIFTAYSNSNLCTCFLTLLRVPIFKAGTCFIQRDVAIAGKRQWASS